MDIRLALMTGIDIPIPELQIILHQPTIKEISFIGEKDFLIGIQCLTIQKTMLIDDERLLEQTSNFQIFMTIMQDTMTKDKRDCVVTTLELLFPRYKIFITPRAISMNCDGENIIIDEGNFENLQSIVHQIFCLSKSDVKAFNPSGKRAKEIANKLMKARQRVAAQKQAENGEGSVFGQYISTLTVGVPSMSLADCVDLTVYQMYDLVERYSLYVSWDIDMRARMAGAKIDKPADNWMKNIH